MNCLNYLPVGSYHFKSYDRAWIGISWSITCRQPLWTSKTLNVCCSRRHSNLETGDRTVTASFQLDGQAGSLQCYRKLMICLEWSPWTLCLVSRSTRCPSPPPSPAIASSSSFLGLPLPFHSSTHMPATSSHGLWIVTSASNLPFVLRLSSSCPRYVASSSTTSLRSSLLSYAPVLSITPMQLCLRTFTVPCRQLAH